MGLSILARFAGHRPRRKWTRSPVPPGRDRISPDAPCRNLSAVITWPRRCLGPPRRGGSLRCRRTCRTPRWSGWRVPGPTCKAAGPYGRRSPGRPRPDARPLTGRRNVPPRVLVSACFPLHDRLVIDPGGEKEPMSAFVHRAESSRIMATLRDACGELRNPPEIIGVIRFEVERKV